MPTRRHILQSLALTTGAAFTRKLPALELSQAQIARDPLRPQYHLQPARGWMNDPCGPIYWKGRYHMFFQYNPHAAVWGDMHWAHASSPDMIHWHREPIALAPTPGGPDQDGCFTGTAVVADGKPTFLYTGVQKVPPEQATLRDGNSNLRETQCLAVAEDDALLHWRKLPQPVIAAPPAGMEVTGFRDPSPWRDQQDRQWYMVVASGEKGIGGNVLLYKSADLRHWQYLHPLAQGKWSGKPGPNPVDTGEMWECPDFFPLDGKHVLIHSTEGKTIWQIGTLDRAAMLFHAESEGIARPRSVLRTQDTARCPRPPHPLGLDSGNPPASRVQRRRLGRHDVAAATPLHFEQSARHGTGTGSRLAPNRAPHRRCGQAPAQRRTGNPPHAPAHNR